MQLNQLMDSENNSYLHMLQISIIIDIESYDFQHVTKMIKFSHETIWEIIINSWKWEQLKMKTKEMKMIKRSLSTSKIVESKQLLVSASQE